MPIHVAITRKVRPGAEADFQKALLEFFKDSFAESGVLGASLLTPVPGAASREFGILRTFADSDERDAFYSSEKFAEWDKRARTFTEGEPVYRELHGLEAWFRSPATPPPRWKMAVATFLGVFPVAMLLNATLGPILSKWPFVLRNAFFNALIVALLTWAVMPVVTRLLSPWLNPKK